MSIHGPILRTLLANPRRTLIVDDQRSWRGIDLLVASLHLAAEIEKHNQSHTLGILLPTSGLFPAAAIAGLMLGKTIVPLNYLLKEEELQYVVDDCQTDCIITVTPLLERLAAPPRGPKLIHAEKLSYSGIPKLRLPARPKDDDVAVLLYTSGTSGRPKGVMLTHGNIAGNARQGRQQLDLNRRDVMLGVLPQFHSFGFTVKTILPLTIGAKAVYSARFIPQQVIRLLRTHRPTAFVAIPSMYNALLAVKQASPDDFASLRYIVSGGEPLPKPIAERFFARFGRRINEGYGLTETSPVTNVCLPDDYREGSVGPPLPQLELRIVTDAGAIAATGQAGEIRFRGPNIMKGYFKLPEATAAVFDADGFFRTGDIGRVDADNHLYITGRLKEMLIVGGENVFPREIEEILLRHAAVKAAGVIGITDPVRGEQPVAFVELEEGHTAAPGELRAFCREQLAGYKVPREVKIVESLPRNPMGKILRRELPRLLETEPQ